MKQKVGAGILLYNAEKNTVILLRRRDNELWSFPGGSVESGESPLEAAIRETREELNIFVDEEHTEIFDSNNYIVEKNGVSDNVISVNYICTKWDDSNAEVNKESMYFSEVDLRASMVYELTEYTKNPIEKLINILYNGKNKAILEALTGN